MSTVFISYRRQTAAGEARSLFKDFVALLGPGAVFMDVDSISLGRDFRSELQKTLATCDHMLVIIDKDWVAAKDERGRIRLENADDYVRMEIETGLKRDITVTPVLIQGARIPVAEELPAEIRNLAYRSGFELGHIRWDSDVRELIRRLRLDVPEQGGQVEMDRRPIAPGETIDGSVRAGAKPRVDHEPRQAAEATQAAVGDRRQQKSRPLAFVQGAAVGRGDTAEARAPPTARQRPRRPLVIAGVLVIFLVGVAAWLTNPATLFKLAADHGSATAQAALGFFYETGRGGLPKDDREAARFFKLAADQGDASAQSKLGGFYFSGRGGLSQDDREAARLFKLAADQGDAIAQAALGFFYETGRGGLPKDDREAARLYKLAADQGDAFAQASLGLFYETGRGGQPKDDREAARLFKLAADHGSATAQAALGFFYETGRGGLPKDDREAARLYKLAADQGDEKGQAGLKRLKK